MFSRAFCFLGHWLHSCQPCWVRFGVWRCFIDSREHASGPMLLILGTGSIKNCQKQNKTEASGRLKLQSTILKCYVLPKPYDEPLIQNFTPEHKQMCSEQWETHVTHFQRLRIQLVCLENSLDILNVSPRSQVWWVWGASRGSPESFCMALQDTSSLGDRKALHCWASSPFYGGSWLCIRKGGQWGAGLQAPNSHIWCGWAECWETAQWVNPCLSLPGSACPSLLNTRQMTRGESQTAF